MLETVVRCARTCIAPNKAYDILFLNDVAAAVQSHVLQKLLTCAAVSTPRPSFRQPCSHGCDRQIFTTLCASCQLP